MSVHVPGTDPEPHALADLPTHASTVAPTTVMPPENGAPAPPPAEPAEAAAPPPPKPPRKPRKLRWDLPSWGVSVLVHGLALVLLIFGVSQTGAVEELVTKLDASLVDTELSKEQAEELIHIYDEPANVERTEAVLDNLSLSGAGGAPTATPNIRSETAEVSEDRSLAGLVPVRIQPPSTNMLPSPSALNADLGGRIGGDVIRESSGYDEALDQLANEILRQLETSRVTVLWMFDESGSMKDDQQVIRDKFDRVINQLNIHVPTDRKSGGDLEHAIIGFGKVVHYENNRPTFDLERIRKSISSLLVDESGEENTMDGIVQVLRRYMQVIDKSRKILLVLVSDESGDDGALVEQTRLALLNRGVVLYVLGRQAMFGFDRVHLRYEDPVTKDIYWPPIKRGPEAPGLELLQYDGLWQDRIDEQPSGFAPYELARLVEDTGGIYFILPNEEELRLRGQREKAYPIKNLKEYVPDYGSRAEYSSRIANSKLRQTLVDIIRLAKQDQFGFRRHYSVNPAELVQQMQTEINRIALQRNALMAFQKTLEALEPERDAEVDRRWKANYDIMRAQVLAFRVKAYEYEACLKDMIAKAREGKLVPKNPPIPGKRRTEWVIDHSTTPKAPKEETEKGYAEATALLKQVIETHPDTPWADLAQTILNRGLSCDWHEWSVHPDYDERAKLVPNY